MTDTFTLWGTGRFFLSHQRFLSLQEFGLLVTTNLVMTASHAKTTALFGTYHQFREDRVDRPQLISGRAQIKR